MTLPEDASNAETFQGIRTAVAQGCDMVEAALPALTYHDEEADLCTLVEASVDDMMQCSKNGTLRLFASTARAEGPVADETPGKMHRPQPVAEVLSAVKTDAEANNAMATETTDAAAVQAEAEWAAAEADQVAAEHAAAEQAAAKQFAAEEQAAAEQAAAEQAAVEQAAAEWAAAAAEMAAADQATVELAGAEQSIAQQAAEDVGKTTTVDAAEVATTSLDAFLCPREPWEGSSERSAPAENSSVPRRPRLKNATRMDHFQVFVANSIFRLRSLDHFQVFRTQDAIDEAAELENTHAFQAEMASDEFLYVPADPTQASASTMNTE